MDEARPLPRAGAEAMEEALLPRRRPLLSRAFSAWWPPLLFLALLLGAWEGIAPQGWLLNPILLPTPHEIAQATWEIFGASYFPKNLARTLYEIGLGFAIAVGAGLVLGTVMAVIPILRLIMYPYIITFQALPKIVLVPLFIVLFGFGPNSKIITAVAIAFFPVFINTMVGLSLVEEDGLRLMRSLTANRWQVFTKLRGPSALPLIFAGVKTSATLAMTGAIVAEFLAGTDIGMGRLISIFSFDLQMDFVFVLVLVIAILAFLLFTVVERVGERVVFWGEDQERGL